MQRLRIVKQFCEREISKICGIRLVNSSVGCMQCQDEDDKMFNLFVWSLLYKHYSLAKYFWYRCNFPIANGLIANSILRTTLTIHLAQSSEPDAVGIFSESDTIQKDEAEFYEKWASSLLSNCDDRSKVRTKFLLLRNMPGRGNISCLELAMRSDGHNNNFLTNPVCIRHLDDIWRRCGNGDWIGFGTSPGIINFLITSTISGMAPIVTCSSLSIFLYLLFYIIVNSI